MVKYFCDHCGRELIGKFNNICADDVTWDGKEHVGAGSILCDECYDEWIKKKVELNRRFFYLEEE